jgi:hypothetical protein
MNVYFSKSTHTKTANLLCELYSPKFSRFITAIVETLYPLTDTAT